MNANIASLRLTVAIFSLLGCVAALAGEDAPLVSIGGFGTLGVVHSSDRQADFTANALNPGDAGASRAWSAAVDRRLGVQMALNLNSKWSALLQLVSERTLRDGYAPVVEWANLQYQATPDLSVRVGRIALPLFLTGEYRKAGYALPWISPARCSTVCAASAHKARRWSSARNYPASALTWRRPALTTIPASGS